MIRVEVMKILEYPLLRTAEPLAANLVVRLRTAAVNAVRGLAKPCGYRLSASSTLCLAKRCIAVLPPGLAQALGPVLEQIDEMTKKIKHYDRLIKELTETEYPETTR
jgi:transposase